MFVDTNILLDLLANDPLWLSWSITRLQQGSENGPVKIDAVVYAELSVRFSEREELDAFVSDVGLVPTSTPKQALFLAGKAFAQYRVNGGPRTSVLPDFFIGAHALAAREPLLTRDPRRYRTYFPTVELITP